MRKLDSAKELLRSSTPVLFTADGVNTTHNRLMGMVRLNRRTLATISVLEYNPSPTATSRATSAASCPRRWDSLRRQAIVSAAFFCRKGPPRRPGFSRGSPKIQRPPLVKSFGVCYNKILFAVPGKGCPVMKYQQWSIPELPAGAVDRLTGAGYPYLVSSVLASRGITTPEEAAAFLERDRDLPYSPFLMKDMDKAAQRVSRALADGEKIAVFGDYDVDGITATVILVDYLLSRGGDVVHYIPRRIEDGYGLGKDAILSLHGQGVRLLVTVDCGITGVEEVAYANSLGMDVVVTDHHECKEELPPACAVVDPHRPDCGYPFKHLAGCGVALKLVLALGGESREEALLSRYCTLAAIGTVADVMQMSGENRTIVSRGLASISRSDFIGLHALLHEAGLSDKTVTSVQIGFVLAPRINAAGRMGAADMAADLLLCTDPHRAEHLARELCALNRERQAVEQEIYSQAVEQIEETPPQERSASWPPAYRKNTPVPAL